MFKRLFLLLSLTFFSGVHSDNVPNSLYNYAFYIDDCPNFIADSELVEATLKVSCLLAKFDGESVDKIYTNGTCYRIKSNKGYALIVLGSYTPCCYIEFYCVDDSYDYEEFAYSIRSVIALTDTYQVYTDCSY